ncbi:hypothetical protein KCU89_g11150, partial [Aureobasidium melanogenum]
MSTHRCVSGPCRKVGTLRCGSCKTTHYCSKVCQKAHRKRHKLTCNGLDASPPLASGVFDLMMLPRELRNKIYEAVVVSRLSSPEQAAYDELSALDGQADLRSRRRNDLDALERHRMVSPGISVVKIRNELIEQANFTYAFVLLTIFRTSCQSLPTSWQDDRRTGGGCAS